ncbi:hypothetical protein HZB88_04840 [archaeon]|nr:hypothetical protein [archaeon]
MKKEEENRLYFIIRSWLMGYVGAAILFITVFILGSINFIQTVIISTFAFFASLAISRLFDRQIGKIVRKILKFLDKNQKIKNLIVNHF